jgi:prepilin signal peptidase PulO-like enzyme (type II secretory pathway)
LPRGLNLAYPGSFCPHCGHPIRGADNIPILSWLMLRGRCRDCGGRISPRYFVVELTMAVLFLLVLMGESFIPAGLGFPSGFVPRRLLTPHDGVPFWCMYAIHVTLVTTVLGAILIEADGYAVLPALFVPVLVFGFAAPLIWPEIRSLPAIAASNLDGWRAGLIDGVLGLAAGLGLATWIRLCRVPTTEKWSGLRLAALGCSIGAVLGWQRTLFVFPVTWILSMLAAAVLNAIIPSNHQPSITNADATSLSSSDEPTLP